MDLAPALIRPTIFRFEEIMSQVTKTDLYRHFDENGTLLYVGVSLSAIYRLSQHKKGSHWHSKISRQEIEHFATREEALDAETRAIQNENPLYNKQKRLKPTPLRREKYDVVAAAHKEEMEKYNSFPELLHGRLAFRPEEACKYLSVELKTLNKLMDSGGIRYFRLGKSKRSRRIPARAIYSFLAAKEPLINVK